MGAQPPTKPIFEMDISELWRECERLTKQRDALLEALQELVDSHYCRSGGFEQGEIVPNYCAKCEKARAAISQAKGVQS